MGGNPYRFLLLYIDFYFLITRFDFFFIIYYYSCNDLLGLAKLVFDQLNPF